MSSTVATLSGSYSSVTGTPVQSGFVWGTSADALNNTYIGSCAPAFTGLLKNLHNETTYYYKAYTTVKGTGSYSETRQTFYGGVESFTTKEDLMPKGWLELPAKKEGTTLFYDKRGTGKSRNYSYCYDKDRYASLWTAYPLTYTHTQGNGHTSSWRWNDSIDHSMQVNVKDHGYGTNYGDDSYDRGHMCPNADRVCDDSMNEQTYYLTNQLPQKSSFNTGIWKSLEDGVRKLVPSTSTDTVYVVAGPCYRKAGGSETINHLTAVSGVSPSTVDIPNYFYKVLLKVKWSGNQITSASAIGFWFDHKDYGSGAQFSSCAYSVDQIETWTGINFFANLPDSVEADAETNSSWTTFSNF